MAAAATVAAAAGPLLHTLLLLGCHSKDVGANTQQYADQYNVDAEVALPPHLQAAEQAAQQHRGGSCQHALLHYPLISYSWRAPRVVIAGWRKQAQ